MARGGGGGDQQRVQVEHAKWSMRPWWIRLTAEKLENFCDESLVDATESGDLAFSFGNFPVSRSCRPFFASHAFQWAALFGECFHGRTNKFSFQILRRLWCTVSERAQKWTSISWSHASMKHSHRCHGVDCKQSGCVIALRGCRALVFQSACRADDVDWGNRQGQPWQTLCTTSAKEALWSASWWTRETWRASLNMNWNSSTTAPALRCSPLAGHRRRPWIAFALRLGRASAALLLECLHSPRVTTLENHPLRRTRASDVGAALPCLRPGFPIMASRKWRRQIEASIDRGRSSRTHASGQAVESPGRLRWQPRIIIRHARGPQPRRKTKWRRPRYTLTNFNYRSAKIPHSAVRKDSTGQSSTCQSQRNFVLTAAAILKEVSLLRNFSPVTAFALAR